MSNPPSVQVVLGRFKSLSEKLKFLQIIFDDIKSRYDFLLSRNTLLTKILKSDIFLNIISNAQSFDELKHYLLPLYQLMFIQYADSRLLQNGNLNPLIDTFQKKVEQPFINNGQCLNSDDFGYTLRCIKYMEKFIKHSLKPLKQVSNIIFKIIIIYLTFEYVCFTVM